MCSFLNTFASYSFTNHAQTNLQQSPVVLSAAELLGLSSDQGIHILELLDSICGITSTKRVRKEYVGLILHDYLNLSIIVFYIITTERIFMSKCISFIYH